MKFFKLSNDDRKCLALLPINENWELVELKKNFILYYDGEKIKKTISCSNTTYIEDDVDIQTEGRKAILPKTSRGKKKNITISNISAIKSSGCKLEIGLVTDKRKKSFVVVHNPKAMRTLLTINDKSISSFDELRVWIDKFISIPPSDYLKKVEHFRNLKLQHIKYKVGDVFRFDIDRDYCGYGKIIGIKKDIIKWGVLTEKHPLHKIPMVPLIVRLYGVKTTNKEMIMDELNKYPLLPSNFIADDNLFWGQYEIIGNEPLEVDEVDFPMGFYLCADDTWKFFWGLGVAFGKDCSNKKIEFPKEYSNMGVGFGVPIHLLEKYLKGEHPSNEWGDLKHPNNKVDKDAIFSLVGITSEIEYDEFCRKTGGLTRQEYINRITK